MQPCTKTTTTTKMIKNDKNDDITGENIRESNPNWPQIPDHPYRISITGSSISRKTNALLNLRSQHPDIHTFIHMLRIHMKQNANC